MEDIRHYLNLMRKEHSKNLLIENDIDSSTSQTILSMFKESVNETTIIENISNNDGTFNINGNISLEIKFQITINNNENASVCNIWFENSQLELTAVMVDIISKLYFFYENDLSKYTRENIV